MINECLKLKWWTTRKPFTLSSVSNVHFHKQHNVSVRKWLNVTTVSPIYVDRIEFGDKHGENMWLLAWGWQNKIVLCYRDWNRCRVWWWRHQMETCSALVAICAGNSPVSGEFPAQRPVTRSFDVFLIRAWINHWVNNDEAGDFRGYCAHYDVIVMWSVRTHFVCEVLIHCCSKCVNKGVYDIYWLRKLWNRFICICWKFNGSGYQITNTNHFKTPTKCLCNTLWITHHHEAKKRPKMPRYPNKPSDSIVMATAQIAKTVGSISIRHRSDEKVSDRRLIDVDPTVFAIWVVRMKQRSWLIGDIGSTGDGCWIVKFWRCSHLLYQNFRLYKTVHLVKLMIVAVGKICSLYFYHIRPWFLFS